MNNKELTSRENGFEQSVSSSVGSAVNNLRHMPTALFMYSICKLGIMSIVDSDALFDSVDNDVIDKVVELLESLPTDLLMLYRKECKTELSDMNMTTDDACKTVQKQNREEVLKILVGKIKTIINMRFRIENIVKLGRYIPDGEQIRKDGDC